MGGMGPCAPPPLVCALGRLHTYICSGELGPPVIRSGIGRSGTTFYFTLRPHEMRQDQLRSSPAADSVPRRRAIARPPPVSTADAHLSQQSGTIGCWVPANPTETPWAMPNRIPSLQAFLAYFGDILDYPIFVKAEKHKNTVLGWAVFFKVKISKRTWCKNMLI